MPPADCMTAWPVAEREGFPVPCSVTGSSYRPAAPIPMDRPPLPHGLARLRPMERPEAGSGASAHDSDLHPVVYWRCVVLRYDSLIEHPRSRACRGDPRSLSGKSLLDNAQRYRSVTSVASGTATGCGTCRLDRCGPARPSIGLPTRSVGRAPTGRWAGTGEPGIVTTGPSDCDVRNPFP
jgi:hypothetical protein